MRCVSTRSNSGNGRKLDKIKKKNYQSECPLSVDRHCPVEASQILTVLSSLTLVRDLPSGIHVTSKTHLKAFKSVSMHKNIFFKKVFEKLTRSAHSRRRWQTVNVDTHVPVDVSQILTFLSQLPLATCFPSGLKETLETGL
jgi:hypothetical protein